MARQSKMSQWFFSFDFQSLNEFLFRYSFFWQVLSRIIYIFGATLCVSALSAIALAHRFS